MTSFKALTFVSGLLTFLSLRINAVQTDNIDILAVLRHAIANTEIHKNFEAFKPILVSNFRDMET